MKAVYYITFCILVLAISVLIHKPSSVEMQKTESRVVKEVQEPLRTSTAEREHHENEGQEGLRKGDTGRRSDLVEKERASIEGPRTSFQAAVERTEADFQAKGAAQARQPQPSSAAYRNGDVSERLWQTHAALEEAFSKLRRKKPVDEGYDKWREGSSSRPAARPDFPSEEEVLAPALDADVGNEEDDRLFEDFDEAIGQYFNDSTFVGNSPFE